MLKLDIDHRSEKFINGRLPKHRGQILRKLESLCLDPYPPDSKMLGGYSILRADIGEYRIAYRVEESYLKVYMIGKRNDDDVYRRLKRLEK